MGKRCLTAPVKRGADRSGETIAGWELLAQIDGQTYRARHTCGFERILPLAYLRECERRKTTGCASCYAKPPRPAEKRVTQVGTTWGVWRVVSLHTDGATKYERYWLCECVRCGARRVICEHVLPAHRTNNTRACNVCKGKDVAGGREFVQWIDRGDTVSVCVRTRAGDLYFGTLTKGTRDDDRPKQDCLEPIDAAGVTK